MSEKFSADKLAEELETIVTEANASEQFRFSKLNRSIMDAIIARLRAADVISKNYDELLFEVARKFPGETRHETARRYIREAESRTNGAAKAIADYEKGEPT